MFHGELVVPWAVAFALLLAAAHAAGRLFVASRQPRVIGEIVGGLLLGPTLLSTLFPDVAAWAFPKSGAFPVVAWAISQLGLILLMYSSGMQLCTVVPRTDRRAVASMSLAGIALPFVAGLVAVQFVDQQALQGAAHDDIAFLLVFATAIAIASIPVISRIMFDLGILATPFGRMVVATAVIDDLALYLVLAVALGRVNAQSAAAHAWSTSIGLAPGWEPLIHVLITLALIAGTLLAGPWLVRRVFRPKFAAARWDNGALGQSALLLAVAGLCLWLGVNPMFGALALGIVTGRVRQQLSLGESRSISRIGLGVFIPLYFALVGLKLDLLRHFDVQFFLGFLAFACIVKAASVYLGARLGGEGRSSALNFAVALNARGGPGIVLATVAFDAGIINESFFAILVLLAIVTSLIAGSWLGAIVRRRGELRTDGALDGWRPSATDGAAVERVAAQRR